MSDTPDVTTEVTDVEPVEAAEVEDTGDSEEQEYQARMKEIRATEKKTAKPKRTDEEVSDDEEYEAEMAKIKADKKSRDDARKAEEEENEEKENPKPEAKKKDDKPKEKRILKLKINGKEEDFDATDDGVVAAEIQKGRAAQEKFKEASTIRKQALNFVEALKTNPIAALSHPSLGLDLKKICEEYLYENVVKQEMMSPEERQREQEKRELEAYRKAEADRKAQKENQDKETMKEKYRQDWSVKFKDALSQTGLPATDWTVKRMAEYMKVAISKGHKHIQPIDVAKQVKEDWERAAKDLYSSVDGEKLIELIGKDNVDKIRKANLKRYDDSNFTKPETTTTQSRPQTRKTETYSSKEEMMRSMRRGA